MSRDVLTDEELRLILDLLDAACRVADAMGQAVPPRLVGLRRKLEGVDKLVVVETLEH
jgi:hypothetical protein